MVHGRPKVIGLTYTRFSHFGQIFTSKVKGSTYMQIDLYASRHSKSYYVSTLSASQLLYHVWLFLTHFTLLVNCGYC